MIRSFLCASIVLFVVSAPSFAQDWALQGYDAVGYLNDNRAEPGRAEIHTKWKGQMWLFISEDHRNLFEGNPHAYAPGFDGLCPVSLAQGRQEAGDPRYFAVIGERLYLLRSNADLQALIADPRSILSQARKVYSGGD